MPGQEVQVHVVVIGGGADLPVALHRPERGAVDPRAVPLEPAADLAQGRLELGLDGAVRARPDVHQQVAAARRHLDEVGDDVGAGLAAREVRRPRPLPAEGVAGLPRQDIVGGGQAQVRRRGGCRRDDRRDLVDHRLPVVALDDPEQRHRVDLVERGATRDRARDRLLGGEEVGRQLGRHPGGESAEAVVDQAARLQPAHQLVEPLHRPLVAEADVPPEREQLAVLRAQLGDLGLHHVEEAGPLRALRLAEERLRQRAG